MTRKLVASLFTSVDGVAADPYLFQYDSFDDDLGAWMTQAIDRVDDAVLGRVSYTEWAGYWPTVTEGEDVSFADFINHVPKHVASRTLRPEDLAWKNSRLIEGDLVEAISALKQTEGGDIAVEGSLSVVRQLVMAGLMDELTLVVHPAVAGTGRRLFDEASPTRLALLDVQRTSKGNLLATYGPHQG
ncbi:dihydrofolate reductase family protein [Luteococcus peritonei]|uniref:Dihydrofolate reductase family protein n=1 Tax=Luteococcus peritonei TaxID=88874 RepID=A0ABW4RYM3_9ACTN